MSNRSLEEDILCLKEVLAMSESLRQAAEARAKQLEQEVAAARKQLQGGSNADVEYARVWEKNDRLLAEIKTLKDEITSLNVILKYYQGEYLKQFQTPEAKAAMEKFFNATPEELGQAAVEGAKRDKAEREAKLPQKPENLTIPENSHTPTDDDRNHEVGC